MHVLVVEDSPRMAEVMRRGLSEERYAVDVEHDGAAGLQLARTGSYDIVLLDVNLPTMDGFEFVKSLRETRSDVPVIMVTARDAVGDRIYGLDKGADDYLVKPFVFEELLARMRALLRRPGARQQAILRFDDIEVNPATGRATRAGKTLALSAREYALLLVFLSNPNRVLTRSKLYESVWNTEFDGLSNVLDVYVNYLRNKLEDNGGRRVIYSVRGRGYVMQSEEY